MNNEIPTRQPASATGYLLAFTATALWAGNFIVARGLSHSMPPVTLAFLRWATAVTVLLPFGLRPLCRDIKIVLSNPGYFALTAFLGVTICNTLIYISAHSSKALNMSLIFMCVPAFTVVLARTFLQDTLTSRRIAGLFIAFVGVVLLITHGHLWRLLSLTFSEGDEWMLGAAASLAIYGVLVRRKPVGLSPAGFLSATFILGLLFLLPWLLWETATVSSINFSSSALEGIIYLGVGPSLLGFLCWNRAIASIGPVRSGFVLYCHPLLSGVSASLLLGEPINLISVLSGIVIIAGVIVATLE